jgi:hypothetical protein
MRLSICAVIAVRNEFPYLRLLLPLLAKQGIEVAIIDNQSTDGSQRLYADYWGSPVILVESLPYSGYFSLSKQLEAKLSLIDRLPHDWIVHHDADEILEHYQPGLGLREAIEEAEAAGCNTLNFDEFVFLPEPGSDYSGRDYYTELLRYYFYEPQKNRLNRAWKRVANRLDIASGGHRLQDGASIFPVNHVLRHYIVLSASHAQQKYLNRCFDEADLLRGWHRKRLNLTAIDLALPGHHEYLFTLERGGSKAFHRGSPASNHYWQWRSTPALSKHEK